jgi:stearoyl-CoA desaturase (delta-9 desaturase)
MSTIQRYANLGAVVVPFLALLLAIVLLWNRAVGAIELSIMAFMYCLTGLGITVGYHRMLTHKAFQASKPVEYFWAIAGSMAVQGPAIAWVADHRKHHAHTDEEGDPHSPHVGQGSAEFRKYAADLCDDRGMRWISRNFLAFVGLSLAIPFALGFFLHGFSITGALWTLLWAGFVRIFFLHHATWSINSVCHFFGRRRFDVEDKSTNVAWLALPTFGESWHHNHHAFPRSARQGLGKYEVDLSAMVIWAMERVGLIHTVVRIAPERQAAKLVGAKKPAPVKAAA